MNMGNLMPFVVSLSNHERTSFDKLRTNGLLKDCIP